jgi:hypothetical protein
MPPSYPNWDWESNLSIRFIAPAKHIVYKVFEDSEEEECLRKKAAGTILFKHVRDLAAALSRHRIQIKSVTSNELDIVMFLPPPPCPPPKRRKRCTYKPRLEPIHEFQEEPTTKTAAEKSKTAAEKSTTAAEESTTAAEESSSEWITLYQYVPAQEQCKLVSGCSAGCL